jgi:hypothetical protein
MYARGLSGEILDKLEEMVPVSARSRMKDGRRVRWNSVGQLHKDMKQAKKDKRPGHFFGAREDKQVLAALELASSGLRPLARRQIAERASDHESVKADQSRKISGGLIEPRRVASKS